MVIFLLSGNIMPTDTEPKNNFNSNKEKPNDIKIELIQNILDGAKSQFPPIAPELESQRKDLRHLRTLLTLRLVIQILLVQEILNVNLVSVKFF